MKNEASASGLSLAILNTMASLSSGTSLIEEKSPAEFTIKIANTIEERESVFKLAYQVYLEKGYIRKNTNERLVYNYDFNDETVIFIVQDKHKNIVGTVTLVFEGATKLPAEKIYSDELSLLRKSGNTLAEMSRLVIDPAYRSSKEILVLLFNYSSIYIRQVKCFNSLIIECNPRHKNFYLALLKCTEIGGQKPCPQVQNAPAVLLHLSADKYEFELHQCLEQNNNNKKERSLYPHFLKTEQESLVAYYLEKQVKPISVGEKAYFGLFESGIGKAVTVKKKV